MIIRPHGRMRLLITQPEHAALSARIMERWRADGLADSPRREAILLAIREHDNGWREPDAAPITGDDGAVLDFVNAPDRVRQAVWPRGVERLSAAPYAAALVAQHALHIYRRYRDQGAWDSFFAQMERARTHHLDAARVGLETLGREYLYLRVGDLLSLTFCNGWTDVQRDDSGSNYTVQLEGDRLLVTPDPFGGAVVPLEIDGRALPEERFPSDDEAAEAWQQAERVALAGVACGHR